MGGSMGSIRDKYAFVGIGLTKQGSVPELTVDQLAVQAGLRAIEDAGIKKADVGGYIFQPGIGGGPSAAAVRDIGVAARFVLEMQTGGTTAIAAMGCAIGAMEAGICEAVILLYATSASSMGVLVGAGNQGPSTEGAYGWYSPTAMVAAMARRYMTNYRITEEHLGMVAVTLRENANRRPDAVMYGKKLTIDDYLKSRYVVEPLRARDCCLVNDGAVALILTTAERAKSLRRSPVYVMGYGLDHSQREASRTQQAIYQFDGPITDKAKEVAFGMADVRPENIDVAQFYDAFTISLITQLSSYGFCERGEEAAFLEEGNIRLDGRLPCNTSGTEQSWSYLQGFTHLTEGIRQMRGEGGECQIRDAGTCLVSGFGGTGTGVSASCAILRREV
jgi:acetyl-CoA acetyltransferase